MSVPLAALLSSSIELSFSARSCNWCWDFSCLSPLGVTFFASLEFSERPHRP